MNSLIAQHDHIFTLLLMCIHHVASAENIVLRFKRAFFAPELCLMRSPHMLLHFFSWEITLGTPDSWQHCGKWSFVDLLFFLLQIWENKEKQRIRRSRVFHSNWSSRFSRGFYRTRGFFKLWHESLKIIHFVICWWSNWMQIFDQKVYIDVPKRKMSCWKLHHKQHKNSD